MFECLSVFASLSRVRGADEFPLKTERPASI